MAKTDIQRSIEKAVGISRFTSGAATKYRRKINKALRRKSRGGQGG